MDKHDIKRTRRAIRPTRDSVISAVKDAVPATRVAMLLIILVSYLLLSHEFGDVTSLAGKKDKPPATVTVTKTQDAPAPQTDTPEATVNEQPVEPTAPVQTEEKSEQYPTDTTGDTDSQQYPDNGNQEPVPDNGATGNAPQSNTTPQWQGNTSSQGNQGNTSTSQQQTQPAPTSNNQDNGQGGLFPWLGGDKITEQGMPDE